MVRSDQMVTYVHCAIHPEKPLGIQPKDVAERRETSLPTRPRLV
jgi:hypothetical protein